MAKVSRVGCSVYVAHAGVVDASVDWLAVDVGFVACYSGGDFAGVDGDGLCYRVLALVCVCVCGIIWDVIEVLK